MTNNISDRKVQGVCPSFPFKEYFFEEVKSLVDGSGGVMKGMVSAHAHLDRAFTLTRDIWDQSMALMEEKWVLVDAIRKKNATDPAGMKERVRGVLDMMIEQGVAVFHTHVDADLNTELKVVEAMAELRDEYKDRLVLRLCAHPAQGFLNEDGSGHNKKKIEIFEKACSICDGVGGLPSADRRMASGDGDLKHMDVIFGIAKNLGKDLDVHIDQENNPLERDTDKLIAKTREHGYEGHVNFLHCISVAAQKKSVRTEIIKGLKDVGANVIVCPTAALAMKQHDDKTSPVHNSIAPVPELVEAGVNVAFGFDNISDVYQPEISGDVWEEVRVLASACRYYKVSELAKILTLNGYKTFKLI
ncbi:MAG: amidohydrolase family protein [Candidatus Gracilibacteria bacterium]